MGYHLIMHILYLKSNTQDPGYTIQNKHNAQGRRVLSNISHIPHPRHKLYIHSSNLQKPNSKNRWYLSELIIILLLRGSAELSFQNQKNKTNTNSRKQQYTNKMPNEQTFKRPNINKKEKAKKKGIY